MEDGRLTIGVLLPKSGPGTELGQSALRAIRTAIRLINDNGGVLGNDVRLVEANEGVDNATADQGIAELIDARVDVIIGPASSNIAVSVLSSAFEAGIPVCSPAATTIALDDIPDDGLLIRTVASDSLQAVAIAGRLNQTSRTNVSIAYVDDPYGQAFRSSLESALPARGLATTTAVGFDVSDDNFVDEAALLLNAGPASIALIGDADAGVRMLAAIVAQSSAGELPDIVINDTLRRPNSVDPIIGLSPEARGKIIGIAPRLTSTNAEFLAELELDRSSISSTVFATSSYDCVNIAALAAERLETTDGRTIMAEAHNATVGGKPCTSFVTCKVVVMDNFDYDGPDAALEIGTNGNRTKALFDQFAFDENGIAVSVDPPLTAADT